MLVTGDPADRHPDAQSRHHPGSRRPQPATGHPHLGQRRHRHTEQIGELLVPCQSADVEQKGARGIGGIGAVDGASGQLPQQPAVHSPERQVGTGFHFALVQEPGQLGGREVGVEDEAGTGADQPQVPGRFERAAPGDAAPVLPDDGAVASPARPPIPQHHGLALIGDPDGGDGLAQRRQ